MRRERETIAHWYMEALAEVEEIELPHEDINRLHSWHLFPIRLQLKRLAIDRNEFVDELKKSGVGCSVHWRPLHLHPYYQEIFGWQPKDFPVATALWERLVSLPLFPGMRHDEVDRVIRTIKSLCARHASVGSLCAVN
jgi:perosamine synthetase